METIRENYDQSKLREEVIVQCPAPTDTLTTHLLYPRLIIAEGAERLKESEKQEAFVRLYLLKMSRKLHP